MAAYQIGEVERLLGVKAHVLRYWEKEFPLLQPRKDGYGRREYSGRDLRLLMRLRYLLHDRRFTVEGARSQVEREMSGTDQDARALLDSIRAELVGVYFVAHRVRAQAAKALGEEGDEEGSI